MRYIISVDLGTTNCKCSAYDESGACARSVNLDCSLQFSSPGYAEQDVSVWYEGVCTAIRDIVESSGENAVFQGIGISSQGISVVPVDEKFLPLRPALSWLDTRASAEAEYLGERIGREELFEITGKFLSPSYTLPKLLWLREHEPEVNARAAKYLMPMDYLAARLTGRCATDGTMAAGTLLYDIESRSWSKRMLEVAGLHAEQLPEVLPNGAIVGTLNTTSAALTGLPAETPVFNGGQDQKIAAFGAGASKENVTLSLGTAGALEMLVQDAKKQRSLPCFPTIFSDGLILEGCISTAGAAIKWTRDTLCAGLSYGDMDRLSEQSQPGSGGVRFYPYLSLGGTPHQGKHTYGKITGLSLSTSKADILRALYEGIGFECRMNLHCAEEAGAHFQRMTVFGGGGKSAILCRTLADITGLPVTVLGNAEACSYGAAKLAAYSLGWDRERFLQGLQGGQVLEPENHRVEEYQRLYNEYLNNLS